MGMFYNYLKYPKSAVIRERQDRVKKAEEDHARFETDWSENEDLQKVRAFKEQEKLSALRKFDFIDGEQKVEFSKNINDADDYVDMINGEGGMRESEEEEEHQFSAELLSVGDQVADNDSFELSDWKDYELKKQDVFLIENLLTALNS